MTDHVEMLDRKNCGFDKGGFEVSGVGRQDGHRKWYEVAAGSAHNQLVREAPDTAHYRTAFLQQLLVFKTTQNISH